MFQEWSEMCILNGNSWRGYRGKKLVNEFNFSSSQLEWMHKIICMGKRSWSMGGEWILRSSVILCPRPHTKKNSTKRT
jgi:hypothetical protein